MIFRKKPQEEIDVKDIKDKKDMELLNSINQSVLTGCAVFALVYGVGGGFK